MSGAIRPGDWVTVCGQVRDEPIHADDVAVEFFSHNAQFTAAVRRDRVAKIPVPWGIASRCTALVGTSDIDGPLYRCTLHDGHGCDHETKVSAWPDSATVGWIERRS